MRRSALLALAVSTLGALSCSQLKQRGDVLAPCTPELGSQTLELRRIDFSPIDVAFKFAEVGSFLLKRRAPGKVSMNQALVRN